MDVKTVCLGILTDGAASGYDLKKHFESTFGHFFSAGFGSIYPALSALADQGLVTCEHVPQEGKPDRKVYAITQSGREFLDNALRADLTPCHKIRSDFLATMCFAHLMSVDDVETVLNNRIKDVEFYQKMISDAECCHAADWPPGMRFVAGFGMAMTETMRRYVEENRHLLTGDKQQKTASA